VIRLGRGWYLMRWPYRRRYADYLWMPGTTRAQKAATWLREIWYEVKQRVPVGVRHFQD
jgi:hypothetical protein